jgi:hypothetical protein
MRYRLLATGAVPGCNSILNSMSLSGGILGRSSGKISRNSCITSILSTLFATMCYTNALRQIIAGRCKVTLPFTGESRQTRWADMSRVALCSFIQLIPGMTSISCPSKIMKLVGNTHPDSSSGVLRTIRLATTRPPGVMII